MKMNREPKNRKNQLRRYNVVSVVVLIIEPTANIPTMLVATTAAPKKMKTVACVIGICISATSSSPVSGDWPWGMLKLLTASLV